MTRGVLPFETAQAGSANLAGRFSKTVMGAIRESSTGTTRILEPSHVVGRGPAPKCSLTLNHPHVSAVHAELRWTGVGWELKDLGSRNGTFLDGRRLEASVSTRLEKGSKV